MDEKHNVAEKSENSGRIEHLALLAKHNDKLAFAELLTIFQPFLALTARSFHLPESEYDDLCQVGRMALYRAVQRHEESRGASFVTYARVCIRNAMVSFVRSYAAKNKLSGVSLDDDTCAETLAETGALPEDRLVIEEFVREINRAMDRVLSETERTVMRHSLAGLGVAEISVMTGKSTKSVENTLFRARKKLRETLRTE